MIPLQLRNSLQFDLQFWCGTAMRRRYDHDGTSQLSQATPLSRRNDERRLSLPALKARSIDIFQ
jgi:hypothetical protein